MTLWQMTTWKTGDNYHLGAATKVVKIKDHSHDVRLLHVAWRKCAVQKIINFLQMQQHNCLQHRHAANARHVKRPLAIEPPRFVSKVCKVLGTYIGINFYKLRITPTIILMTKSSVKLGILNRLTRSWDLVHNPLTHHQCYRLLPLEKTLLIYVAFIVLQYWQFIFGLSFSSRYTGNVVIFYVRLFNSPFLC